MNMTYAFEGLAPKQIIGQQTRFHGEVVSALKIACFKRRVRLRYESPNLIHNSLLICGERTPSGPLEVFLGGCEQLGNRLRRVRYLIPRHAGSQLAGRLWRAAGAHYSLLWVRVRRWILCRSRVALV